MATQSQWHRISKIFEEALERPREGRQAWVAQACGDDSALREEVEKLLAAFERAEGILDRPLDPLASEALHDASSPVRRQQVGPYRITEEIGRGGMGVVYKAVDTRLDRTVALKFLAAHAVSDNEVRKRFVREAKAAAALNHPNICTVYEIAEVEGETFISMAYIEGASLDKKITAGPLPLPEALDIAQQVAEGLQDAHTHGIVHRDIKPANIMMAPQEGRRARATITDFGLAQLADRSKLTQKGMLLGTPAYMSPEQTEGRAIDRRTDIWSLGVVLHEMVCGRPPFRGEYEQAIIYSILNADPEPLTALRSGVPMELDWIVAKALAKDPADRYPDAASLIVDLRTLQKKLEPTVSTQTRGPTYETPPQRQAVAAEEQPAVVPPKLPQGRRLERFVLGTLLAVVIALAVWGFVRSSAVQPEFPLRRFSFVPPKGAWEPKVSPDGRHIAYLEPAGGALWIQPLDREEPFSVEGTEGARGPFWSPDSESVGYQKGRQIFRARLGQGRPVPVCDLPEDAFSGGAWSPDGSMIAFCIMRRGIYEVAAQGGQPRLAVENGPYAHTESLSYLPSTSRTVLFAGYVREVEEHHIVAQSLEDGRKLVVGVSQSAHPEPAYSPTGHVFYTAEPKITPPLRAVPFSPDRFEVTGESFVVDRSTRSSSVSNDGTLVFLDPGEIIRESAIWRGRAGERLASIGQAHDGAINQMQLSPDGKRLAISAWRGDHYDVWIHDTSRAVMTRFTFDANAMSPVWSPGGDQLAYVSRQDGFGIYVQPADGTGQPKLLLKSARSLLATNWSPDGKYLLYTVRDPTSERDIWYLALADDGGPPRAIVFQQTRFNEQNPVLSPDGRYVAYSSDESGAYEIYVRPFPQGPGRWRVSTNHGMQPRWSRTGREIFYVQEQTLMAAPVATNPRFEAGTPVALYQDPGFMQRFGPYTGYEVALDGSRILAIETQRDIAHPTLRVVQNWFAEFRESR